jgi:cytochrome bd-type quinol oxidase subunit 2
MRTIAPVGVPLVLAYSAFVSWRLRGKVEPEDGAGY